MKSEWENIWTKTWLLACASSDIQNVGEYFNFTIGKESIIVIRSNEDEVSAFYNVCPHRGNRLFHDDFGFVKDIGCRFHGWKFNLDGTNQSVTDSETFRDEVLCYDLDLTTIKVEEECGFVWISMNEDIVSVREYLGEVADHLDLYQVKNMNVIRHAHSEWAANWKTGLESFYETYHLSHIHPQTQGMMEDYYVPIDTSVAIIRKHWGWGSLLNAPIPTLYKIISEHQRAYLAIKEGKSMPYPFKKKEVDNGKTKRISDDNGRDKSRRKSGTNTDSSSKNKEI